MRNRPYSVLKCSRSARTQRAGRMLAFLVPCGMLSAPKSRPLGLRYPKGPDGMRGFAMKRSSPVPWSTWSAVGNLTSRAGEQRCAGSQRAGRMLANAFLGFLRLFLAHLWRQTAPLAPPVWHAVRAEIAAAGLAIRQGPDGTRGFAMKRSRAGRGAKMRSQRAGRMLARGGVRAKALTLEGTRSRPNLDAATRTSRFGNLPVAFSRVLVKLICVIPFGCILAGG